MSTNRRKSHTRRDAVVTDSLLAYLNGDAEARERDLELRFFTSDKEIQAAWGEHKSEILSQWIAEHPGTRPECWWLYDAPREHEVWPGGVKYAMRRQIAGPPIDLTDIKPQTVCGLPVHHLEGRTFETEKEFLERHGLLTDAETR